jgi:hypothetical protein
MRFVLFCAAFATSAFATSAFAASALALELHPGGALVPEETRAVEEAREWLEAALEAAREDDILSREAELEEAEGLEAELEEAEELEAELEEAEGLEAELEEAEGLEAEIEEAEGLEAELEEAEGLEAELEEVEGLEADERQSGRCIGCLARVCCGLERCRRTPFCRAYWAQVEMIRRQG